MLSLALFLTLAVTTFAADEVQFITGQSWKEIKAKAAREKKMIFFDAYAAWCPPCKYMDKNVYTDGSVAAFYNANYINVKMDMEKGEGVTLAEEFDITAYPTLLFFSPEGKLLHKAVGGMDVEDFIALGKDALNPAKQFYTQKEKAKKNQLSGQAFMDWAENAQTLKDEDLAGIARAFLKSKGDLLVDKDASTVALYYVSDLSAKELKYLYDNKPKIEKLQDWTSEESENFIYNKVFTAGLDGYDRTKSVDSFAVFVKSIIPSKASFSRKDLQVRIALFVDEDPEKAMKAIVRAFTETENQLSLKDINSLIIENHKQFDESNFRELHKALANFQFRKMDAGQEGWLYLTQWISALNIGDTKAKEFATKAYKHAALPASYKNILKETYEDL